MGFWGWVLTIIVVLIVLANLDTILPIIGGLIVIGVVLGLLGGIGYAVYEGTKRAAAAEKTRRAELLEAQEKQRERERSAREKQDFDDAKSKGLGGLIDYFKRHRRDNFLNHTFSDFEVPHQQEAREVFSAMLTERLQEMGSVEEIERFVRETPVHLAFKANDKISARKLAIQEAQEWAFAQSKADKTAVGVYLSRWESHPHLVRAEAKQMMNEFLEQERRADEEKRLKEAAEAQQREIERRATELLQEIENQADWLDSSDEETVKRARFFIREKLAVFESDTSLLNNLTKQSPNFRTRVDETYQTLKSNESYSGNLVSRFERTFGSILTQL